MTEQGYKLKNRRIVQLLILLRKLGIRPERAGDGGPLTAKGEEWLEQVTRCCYGRPAMHMRLLLEAHAVNEEAEHARGIIEGRIVDLFMSQA